MFFRNDKYIKIIINKLLVFLNSSSKYKSLPVRKCFIAKSLFVVTMIQDRCLQILVKLVLDPVIESLSDPHNFGFRKNRLIKSALAAVRYTLKDRYCEKFILGISIKSFFDKLSNN